MGRLAIRSGDIVSVNINGKGAAWCDGVFSGDAEIVAHAQTVAGLGIPVDINGVIIMAGTEDAVNAFAAIYSHNPDQAIVIEAPHPVLEVAGIGIMWDHPSSWG